MTAFDRFLLIFGAGLICFGMCIYVTHVKAGECGIASHYGTESGRRTANGEPFPTREPTAAHRSLPFNSRVRVTDQRSGRSIVVRINDRGPFIRGRIIDLSPRAAQMLDMIDRGVIPVCITVVR